MKETKKKLEVILYSDGGLKFLPAAENNFGLSLNLNSHDFKIENSKLKLNYGYGLGIEDDLINLGKTLNVVLDPLNCINYKKIDYKLDGKDISSYGLYIKNGQGLTINNNKLELDINDPFKLENNKLKLNYGNGLRLSKDSNSKLELYIDPHAGLEYWGPTEGEKYLGLSTNIANFIKLVENSGLTLDNYNKLTIDINKLKERLYDVLGDNLIYDSTTKKLDVKNYETLNILKGKMLIEDHSITYLNLQDKSGMKIDSSNNNVTEMMNYRNKIFEYKSDKYDSTYDTKYIADNKNPNENHLKITSGYFESSIIEDYRVTVFVVIKNNTDNLFHLYDNSDHSLRLLYIDDNYIHSNSKNYNISYTTINPKTGIIISTNLPINKKILICVSWNGVNSAAYINGKKNILLLILELVLQQVEFINLIHLIKVIYMNL